MVCMIDFQEGQPELVPFRVRTRAEFLGVRSCDSSEAQSMPTTLRVGDTLHRLRESPLGGRADV